MTRSLKLELMDDPEIPERILRDFYTDLARLNHILGHTQEIESRIRDPLPSTVLDIGCGQGALLAKLRDDLGVRVQGVDLRAAPHNGNGVEIQIADATSDLLPASDVAICVLTVHHLSEDQVVALIRNVGRSSPRLIILDLVRHPLPLALYSTVMRPLISRLVLQDGIQSIRRAYTPEELRALVVRGLAGTNAIFEQWVSPIYAKQVIDISYRA